MNLISILGIIVAAVSLVLLVLARVQLGKSFSVTPKAKELVTHGLYSRIRNPMYVFLDLTLASIALATGSWYPLAPLVIMVPLQTINSRREARVLEEKFGAAYTEYRRGTWF
jgi:protein-S-isoprenylcysteine O-methyltransferase Ste14